jgi:predicted phage tail protein
VTSYIVEVGTYPSAANIAVVGTGNASTSLSATLPAGHYFLRVRARNEFGSSAVSNEVTGVVGGIPGPPTTLAATVTGSEVLLNWNAPSSGSVTSYIIEAGTSSGAANIAAFDTGNTAPAFFAGGVPGGIYFLRVRTRNGFGSGAASNEISIVVGAGPCAPGPATGLSAIVSGNNVTLMWSAPGGAVTTYVVEAGSVPGASNIANIVTGSASTSLTGTAPPGTYFIRIRARNACGTSGASNEASVTVF